MRLAGAFAAISMLMPTLGFAQDGEVYQQGDYFIDGQSTNCGEAQTIVAPRASVLIQERNAGTEIVIDSSRFDPLPHGVKLFIYYQFCTNMFFLDSPTADNYATAIGLREGWMTSEVVEAVCGAAPLSIDAWTEKPDATRCQAIAAVVREARR